MSAAITMMPHSLHRILIALCLFIVVPALSACGFNTIPTNEEKAKAAWSEVQNQYQRRADLVPNLVETVKGYAAHERETLEAVIDARAKATQVQITPETLNNPELFKQFQDNQANLTSALSRLMAVVERYPDLKANQNFLSLQSQLEGTENRIAVARRDYIEAVRVYNTGLKTLPTMLWKIIWFRDAEPMASFTADAASQSAPQVNFNN